MTRPARVMITSIPASFHGAVTASEPIAGDVPDQFQLQVTLLSGQ